MVEQRPLTQDELLAEAARTELDNLRDLEQMVALEEATRKKAMYKRSKYSGPMIRFHSKRIQDVGLVSTFSGCFGNMAICCPVLALSRWAQHFLVRSQSYHKALINVFAVVCFTVHCKAHTGAAQCMYASIFLAPLQLEHYIGLQACQGPARRSKHGCMRPRLCLEEQPKPSLLGPGFCRSSDMLLAA